MNYTKQKLEKLADEVISLSNRGGDSLVEAVLSVLKKNPMNPEQIRRLVEMSNTAKFLDEFSNTSGEDRFVDFDVLDPEEVVRAALKGSPVVKSKSKSLALTLEKTPGGTLVTRRETNDPGLDTEDSQFFADVDSTKEKSAMFSKVAEESMSFTDKYDSSPALKGDQKNLPDQIQAKILKSKGKQLAEAKNKKKKKLSPHDEKMIEEKLRTKKEAASLACDSIASSLSNMFRGIYSREKHAGFELEALANYGLDSLPALQAVRQKLAMPLLRGGSVSPDQVKKASERYVSDKSSTGMPEVGKYIEKLSEYVDACLEIDHFNKFTSKTAAAALPALGLLGLGVTGGNLLNRPMDTTSYVLNKRIHHWADRIEARDETLKDVRKRVVNFALDGIENKADKFFEDRRDDEVAADQKQRRMLAAKTMFKENPDLRSAGKQNAMMAINMVGKVAPELSTSVPFLTAHVKQMVYNSDGGIPVIDAQSIKSMSEAERAFENLGKFKPA